jgi:hypothetical protein
VNCTQTGQIAICHDLHVPANKSSSLFVPVEIFFDPDLTGVTCLISASLVSNSMVWEKEEGRKEGKKERGEGGEEGSGEKKLIYDTKNMFNNIAVIPISPVNKKGKRTQEGRWRRRERREKGEKRRNLFTMLKIGPKYIE